MRAVTKERNVIEVVDDQDVAGVEFGWTPKESGVVSIGNDVALVRTIVHALREGVGDAKLKVAGEATAPVNLQGIVNGVGHVIGFANRAKTFERPQSVDVYAGVGGDRSCGGLVNVGFSLEVQTAAGNVGNADL